MKTPYQFGAEVAEKIAANPAASSMPAPPQQRSWLQWFLGTGGDSNVLKAKRNPTSNISLRKQYLNQQTGPASGTTRVHAASTPASQSPMIRR
jgi:hypothetical protein